MKCIALLHDVLEDSELTADDLLEKGVPKCIVYKVQTLTKAPEEKYMDYIKRVKKDPVCALVKIADIEHNLDPSRFLTDWYAEKRQDENGDYHKTLVTPIKYLATGHLRNIIFKQKGSLEDIEDKILYAQLKNVIHEYKSREA